MSSKAHNTSDQPGQFPARLPAEHTPFDHLRVKLQSIQAMVFDCDGVLTPGDLIYDETGKRSLRFHARDGVGLAIASRMGIKLGIISGRATDIAEARFRELGVTHFVGRCKNKADALHTMCRDLSVDPANTAFVGDDLPDLAAFRVAGLGVAVADATHEVRAAAHMVLRTPGGRGAARELCEAVLKAKGLWEKILAET